MDRSSICGASAQVRTVLDMTRLTGARGRHAVDGPARYAGLDARAPGTGAARCSSSRPARGMRVPRHRRRRTRSARRRIARRAGVLSCPASTFALGVGAFGDASPTAAPLRRVPRRQRRGRRTCPPTAPTCPTTWWRRAPKRRTARALRPRLRRAFARHVRFEQPTSGVVAAGEVGGGVPRVVAQRRGGGRDGGRDRRPDRRGAAPVAV